MDRSKGSNCIDSHAEKYKKEKSHQKEPTDEWISDLHHYLQLLDFIVAQNSRQVHAHSWPNQTNGILKMAYLYIQFTKLCF